MNNKLNDDLFDDIVMGRDTKTHEKENKDLANQMAKLNVGGAAEELKDGEIVRSSEDEKAYSVMPKGPSGSFAFSSTGVQQSTYVGTVNHKTAMDKLLKEAQEWEVHSQSNKGAATQSQYSSDKNDFNESLLDGTTGSQAAAMEPPIINPPQLE